MDEQLILGKIETVMTTFRETEMFCDRHENSSDRIAYVNNLAAEFRSVGYESISMNLAKECLKNQHGFSQWVQFYETYNNRYGSQLLTGLGWALASQQSLIPAELSSFFNAEQLFKINDGFGYYYGLFRSRLAIRNKQLPEELNDTIPSGYYSGLGRALYYHAKGNLNKLTETIRTFDNSNLHEIWQGIGTASFFLGGLSSQSIEQLLQTSGSFQQDYLIGAKSACSSRRKANANTETSTLLERYTNSLEQ